MNLTEYESHLKFKFRKMPKLKEKIEHLICFSLFESHNKLEDMHSSSLNKNITDEKISYIDRIIDSYSINKTIYKQNNLSFDGYIKDNESPGVEFETLEELNDTMVMILEKQKINKFQKSILRNKNDLADEESFLLFQTLFNLNISKDKISDNLKKINAWDASFQLNESLKKIINLFNENSIEKIIFKIESEELNANVISKDNNVAIIEIQGYRTSSAIGSNQWCISYDETYWDTYLYIDENSKNNEEKDIENSTFFIFDFNKPAQDLESMVAFTTKPSGHIIFAHNKNDANILTSYDFSENNVDLIVGQFLFENQRDTRMNYEDLDSYTINTYISENESLTLYKVKEALDDFEGIMQRHKEYELYFDDDTEDFSETENTLMDGFRSIAYSSFGSLISLHLLNQNDTPYLNTSLNVLSRLNITPEINIIKALNRVDLSLVKDELSGYVERLEFAFSDIYRLKNKEGNFESLLSEQLMDFMIKNKSEDNVISCGILLSKDWKNKTFFETLFNESYTNFSNKDKIDLLKNIHIMPPENAELFINKIDNDQSFSLKNEEFTLQDLFQISGAHIISSGDINNYSKLKENIRENIISRNDHFKGNGLFITKDKIKGLYGDKFFTIHKLESIAKNGLIKKNDLKSWMKKAVVSSFPSSGGDTVALLKKEMSILDLPDYLNSLHSDNIKVKTKNKP
jgi:hypothetical protein